MEALDKLSGTIKLFSPIEINGKEIKTLSYDLMKIDEALLTEAERLAHGKGMQGSTEELDYTYHRYLGMAAIIADNPWVDWEDLKRVKGIDLKTISKVGRLFFVAQVEFENEISDEPQEPTADTSTQA